MENIFKENTRHTKIKKYIFGTKGFAKKVITFGVSGNFSIAMTVSNVASYIEGGTSLNFSPPSFDNEEVSLITNQWHEFINALLKL